MTDQEKQQFVDSVKGKKIREWHWSKGTICEDWYFVPNGKWSENAIEGTLFQPDHDSKHRCWALGAKWKPYPEQDLQQPLFTEADSIKKTDTTIKQTTFPKTCQCGAEYTSSPNIHYRWCDKHKEIS